MRFFTLIFFLIFSLYSNNLALIVAENDPSSFVEGVSMITGDLYSFEEDYVVQGAEQVHLYRSFLSREGCFKNYEHLTATFACSANTFFINEHNGAALEYCADPQNRVFPCIGEHFYGEKKKHWKALRYNTYNSMQSAKGVSNTSSGDISAQTNLKNQYLIFDPNLDEQGKSFTLYASNGTRRRYVKHNGQKREKNYPSNGLYLIYTYKLVSETLPNGHIIHYTWDKENRVTSIYTTNASHTKIFSRVDVPVFSPSRTEYLLRGSDGRSLLYKVQPTEIKNLFLESDVISPDLPDQHYRWHLKLQNTINSTIKKPYLQFLDLPQKRTMHIGYSDVEDPAVQQKRKDDALLKIRKEIEEIKPKAKKKPGKYKQQLDSLKTKEKEIQKHGVPNEGLWEGYHVKTLLAPIGAQDTLLATHTFFYDRPNKNSYVLDALNNKSSYFWNDDARLTQIERYQGPDQFHSKESFLWENTQLRCKTFHDEHSNPIFSRVLNYDPFGNVKTEIIYGNFSGKSPALKIGSNGFPEENGIEQCIKRSTYSEDGRNLLLKQEELSTDLSIKYTYRTDSHLLETKTICEGEQEKIRTTYAYDEDLLLRRETIEDGLTCLIKKITPLQNIPFIGMPEAIEEMYGNDLLLRKTVLHYGVGALIEQKDIFDATGKHYYSLHMRYDGKGRLISETNAIGQEAIYSYDDVGNRIYAKDFSGQLETYSFYDHSNRLIKKEEKGDDGAHRTFTYEYDLKHNLISETDAYKNTTAYILDAFGHPKEIHLPPISNEKGESIASITKFKYDSAGNEIEKEDPQGNVTKTEYNAYGKPIRILHPDGATEEFSYFLNGKLQSQKDANKVVTTYEYDYLGRVVKKTISNAIETFEYIGQYLTKKTDAEGNETIYEYDLAGRKIGEETCGEKITYAYDSLGRLFAIQKGDLITFKEFDLLDRIIEERDESTSKEIVRKVKYEYDAAGNRCANIYFINGREEKETFKYDSFNRLIEKKDALDFIETYEYDKEANKKTHTDPMGLQIIEIRNAQNQIASMEKKKGDKSLSLEQKYYNPIGKQSLQIDTIYSAQGEKRQLQTRWEYNSRGLLAKLTEADGTMNAKITGYTYTPRKELETLAKPDGTLLMYRYNDLGHLVSLSSSDGLINYEMEYNRLGHLQKSGNLFRTTDPRGRILSETFSQGHCIINTYDKNGRRQSCKIPEADCFIAYEYDAAYLKTVHRKKLDETLLYSHAYISYDLSGNLTEQNLILNAGKVQFTLDPLSRNKAINASHFSQEILEFDGVGNIQKMRIDKDEMIYTYDDLYQLTSESGIFTHSYAYDSLNNRLQKDDEKYTVNDLNQVPSHLQYDPNGNPIQYKKVNYKYNALDRLICIEAPNFVQTFTYDCLHRCLSKTTKQQGSEKTLYFLYDGQNEIGAFDENLNPIELRILGNTPHAEIGAAIAIELNGQIHVPIHDLQGNVALLLPQNGSPIRYYYSAFGEEQIQGASTNPWRFCSKRSDQTTGLVNFGRRYYFPELGRWLTPDPAGFADGMNLYAYLHNDPLTHLDEYGLFTIQGINYEYYTLPQYCRTQGGSRFLPSLYPNPKYSLHYYVNGIQNTLKENLIGARALLKTYENKANIIPTYSTTFGKVNDLKSVRASKNELNYSTDFIRRFHRELKFNILAMEMTQDPRKIFITCFSRGSTDVYHACKNLSEEHKNRLIITACGPIMILPRSLGFIVQNLVSKGDWCSLKCNPGLEKHPEIYRKYANVEILDQKDGFSGFNKDHFFQSKTYQEGIIDNCLSNYKKYGALK